MGILNHIVYICDKDRAYGQFLDKLSIAGFSCDQLSPDESIQKNFKVLRPSIAMLNANIEKETLVDLFEDIRALFPAIPIALVSSRNKRLESSLLPAADAICYSDAPTSHLSTTLRGIMRLTYSIQELTNTNRKLNEISITDALTGLHNRGYMIERLNMEFKRSGRTREPLSCIMIDLDHFKQVNDTYGHKFGDVVLQAATTRLRDLIRETDVFGRYGGEEFLMILPNCNLDDAEQLAEKLRGGLSGEPIIYEYFSRLVTASFGVASTENPQIITADHLLQLSDQALYHAKETGRNRVCVAGDDASLNVGHTSPGPERRHSGERLTRIDAITPIPQYPKHIKFLESSPLFDLIIHDSSEAFFSALKERLPQVVMIDQSRPDILDALTLCQRVKSQLQDRFIPMLSLLPENAGALMIEQATAAGFDETIAPDMSEFDFFARVRSMIRLKNLHERWRGASQELSMARARLVRAERLTALGEVATGVAHEFNNVLSTILGRAQLLSFRAEDEETLENLKIIEKAARDGVTSIRRIQDFAHAPGDAAHENIELSQVIHDCIQMTRTRWKDEAEMQGVSYRFLTDLQTTLPSTGNPSELREVITNIIMNALDAMPKGGALRFVGAVVADEIVLTITDEGEGMSEDVRKHVFDPFYSTKDQEGTGLGMSVAYGIIARHSGRIDCSSAPGKGTTFRISLPLRRDAAAADPISESDALSASLAREAGAKVLRILVVDDEAPIREIFRDVLTDDGHIAYLAESGEAALNIVERQNLDLVLTDLSMPGMSGWEVSTAISKLQPRVPIVMTSGWGNEFESERLLEHGICHVLPKPIPFETLRNLIRLVSQGKKIRLDDEI